MESSGWRASSNLTDRCWILPVVAACVTFATSLVESSRGYLYVLYMEKFNVDHGVASWPDSILVASEQLSGFAITLLQNKLSVFYITILSIAVCGGGVIAGAFCPNIIWMTVAVGGLYGMGFGATITCFSMYTLAYFDKYRATATAAKYAAWSAAGLTGPSIISFLAGYYGLHGALLLSGAFIIQGAPLVLLLRRPRPFIIWRRLRGAASNDDSPANMTKPHPTSEVSSPIPSSESFTEAPTTQLQDTGLCVALSKKNVSALFHTRDFYILVAFLVLFDWSTSVHSTTAVDYGQAKGAPLEKAKFVLTTTAFGYLVGRTVVPFAADRIPFSRAPFAVAALVTSFVTFLVPSMIESFEWFVALNMILGICQGYVSCMRGVLMSEYLGIHRLPVMAGFTGLFLVPLSTSGPSIVGFFRDTLGSYDNLYAMLGAVNLLAAAMLSILVYRDCAHRKSNWTLANCN